MGGGGGGEKKPNTFLTTIKKSQTFMITIYSTTVLYDVWKSKDLIIEGSTVINYSRTILHTHV